MDYTFRPIQQWPGKLRTSRKASTFKASHSRTLDDLDRELRHLNAKKVVLQIALEERDIRRDGRPRSDARQPRHPGVILTFEKPGKSGPTTLNFPCDTYDSWQDNLRAITLGLAALRAVDRYGVTQNNEQYKGWAQLPPPAIVTPPPMSAADAAGFISDVTCGGSGTAAWNIRESAETFQTCYRAAAMKLHPDRNDGKQTDVWNKLQQAKEVLKKHHGVL